MGVIVIPKSEKRRKMKILLEDIYKKARFTIRNREIGPMILNNNNNNFNNNLNNSNCGRLLL